MNTFLKMLAAVIVGGIVLMLLPVIFVLSMAVAALATFDSSVDVSEGAALHFSIETPITDRHDDSLDGYFSSLGLADNNVGLDQLRRVLNEAATDDRIGCLVLEGTTVNAGFATLREARQLIEEFKQQSHGKNVYYFGQSMDLGALYLASVADYVCVSPQGEVAVNGLSSQHLFYKDMLDKLGVETEVFRCGKYKSAVEPYVQNHMSEASREQMQTLVDQIWQTVRRDIALSRDTTVEAVESYIDSMLFYNPQCALRHKLIDETCFYDEFEEVVYEYNGVRLCDEEANLSFSDYAASISQQTLLDYQRPTVAVVYCTGEIFDGSNPDDPDNIYADDLCETLHDLRDDDECLSVVLRINSPGGSASAAEQIHREIQQLAECKSVVASLGDYAASGGYYIATAADAIVADKATITGSIGVFGLVPCMQRTLGKIGISTERVDTHADATPTVLAPLTDRQRRYFQRSVDEIYKKFLARVADGRKMTVAGVDSIAQGRVWSGTDAKRIGLVDEIMTLSECLDMVKEKLSDEVDIVAYPEYETTFRMLSRRMTRRLRMEIVERFLPEGLAIVEGETAEMLSPQILTRMEFMPSIEF